MNVVNMISKDETERDRGKFFWIMQWSLILLFGTVLCSGNHLTAAEDPLSAKKIQIIRSIAEKAVGKGNKVDMEKVYQQVSKHMLLDEADSEENRSLIEKWKLEAKAKYPLSDSDLRKKFNQQAEREHPLYEIGKQVSIVFTLHGKSFPVSGTYYKSTPASVWVGSKQIARHTIPQQIAVRFDRKQTERIRSNFVENSIRKYFSKRIIYVENKKKYDPAYQLSRGNIRSGSHWFTARKLTDIEVEKQITQAKKEYEGKVSEIFRKNSLDAAKAGLKSLREEYKDTIYAPQINQLCKQVDSAIIKEKSESFDKELNRICQAKYKSREDENLKAVIQALKSFKKQYRNTSFADKIEKKIKEKEEELRVLLE